MRSKYAPPLEELRAGGNPALTAAIADWCQDNLPSPEQSLLRLLLSAGYALSGATLETHPLSGEAVIAAFRRERTALAPVSSERLPEGTRTLTLQPRAEAYRFEEFSLGELPKGKRIATYRIESKRIGVGSEVRLTTTIMGKEQTLTLPRGGYAYVNAVDGQIAAILPMEARNGQYILKRQQPDADTLTFFHEDRIWRLPPNVSASASSFAVDGIPGSFLLIRDGRVQTEYYALRQNYPELSVLEHRDMVEAMIVESDYLLLQATGKVYSSNPRFANREGVVSLLALIHKEANAGRKQCLTGCWTNVSGRIGRESPSFCYRRTSLISCGG